MKCKRGFITYRDEKTKKEHPFFLKVRSKDIVVTTPIKINEHLVKTSELFTLVNEYHGHDYSSYKFMTNTTRTSSTFVESSGERLYSNFLFGGMTYKLFRDGTVDIYGSLHISVSDVEEYNKAEYGKSGTYFQLALPYGIKKISTPSGTPSFLFNDLYVSARYIVKTNADDFIGESVYQTNLRYEEPSNVQLANNVSYHKLIITPTKEEVLYTGSDLIPMQFHIKAQYREDSLEY